MDGTFLVLKFGATARRSMIINRAFFLILLI